MKRLLFSATFLFVLALAACGEDDYATEMTNNAETKTDPEVETNTDVDSGTATGSKPGTEQIGETNQGTLSWENEIALIQSGEGTPEDKYSKLETLMGEYESSSEEVEQFKGEIISDYETQRYLGDIGNSEYMLALLLKTHIVEMNNEGTPLGEFAQTMHQTLKSLYFGEEKRDSEYVKANETKMNESLSDVNNGS